VHVDQVVGEARRLGDHEGHGEWKSRYGRGVGRGFTKLRHLGGTWPWRRWVIGIDEMMLVEGKIGVGPQRCGSLLHGLPPGGGSG